jgi:lysophospholipase L1-like esterase
MPRERRSKYANDAKDTVGIASQVESLSSSLAQKANDSVVRKKSVKLELEDMSANTLGAMSGNATFNLLSIPQDGSVTPEKTNFVEPLTITTNIFDSTKATIDSYIGADGVTILSAPDFVYSDYTGVNVGEDLVMSDSMPLYYVFFYDASKNFVSKIDGVNNPAGTQTTITVPSNISFMRFNLQQSRVPLTSYQVKATRNRDVFNMSNLIIKTENLPEKVVTPEKISFIEPTTGQVNILDRSKVTTGNYIGPDGLTISAAGEFAYSDYIQVNEGESITLSDSMPLYLVFFYDAGKNFISKIDGVNNATITPTIITIPSGIEYIRFNMQLSRIALADYQVVTTRLSGKYNFTNIIDISNSPVISSFWSNKKLLFIGDSITDPTTAAVKYVETVKEKLDCTIINNGISGSGYLSANPIHERIDALPNDADLIAVFAGTNDYGNYNGVTLGAMGDTTNTTFYGAVDLAFTNLIAKYPLKTIVVFTPLPRMFGEDANGVGKTLKDYAEAIKSVARKYSFPVLDLNNEGCFFADNATFRANYCVAADGVHPNTEWHVILARKVIAFLNTL